MFLAQRDTVKILWLSWQCRPSEVKTRSEEGDRGLLAYFRGQGRGAFDRLLNSGLRLLGRRYEVEVFEEIRPDALCGPCSGWSSPPLPPRHKGVTFAPVPSLTPPAVPQQVENVENTGVVMEEPILPQDGDSRIEE